MADKLGIKPAAIVSPKVVEKTLTRESPSILKKASSTSLTRKASFEAPTAAFPSPRPPPIHSEHSL
jgi:hypothetical protein